MWQTGKIFKQRQFFLQFVYFYAIQYFMHNDTTYILFSNKFSFISDVDTVVINLDAVFNKKP